MINENSLYFPPLIPVLHLPQPHTCHPFTSHLSHTSCTSLPHIPPKASHHTCPTFSPKLLPYLPSPSTLPNLLHTFPLLHHSHSPTTPSQPHTVPYQSWGNSLGKNHKKGVIVRGAHTFGCIVFIQAIITKPILFNEHFVWK